MFASGTLDSNYQAAEGTQQNLSKNSRNDRANRLGS
jgi:hypothetical protein